MDIFGIETSCDETAAAVVRDGTETLCSVVHTQIPLHKAYGGVVPEIASRAHVEKIPEVLETALAKYRAAAPDGKIDAVAATYGPGLAPALTVGLNAAKGLALSLGVPLIAINHIEAHLHTPFLRDAGESGAAARPDDAMPALGLAVSGGHTHWFDMPRYGEYRVVGQTLDDAAGEAFDKAAKLLGLGYPGGPVIDRIAREYRAAHPGAKLIPFPKGRPREGVCSLSGLPAGLCVSFSGLKTALLRHVQKFGAQDVPLLAASYQEAVVAAIADRTRTALRRTRYKSLIVGGGVSLNSRLREVLSATAREAGVEMLAAKACYCGDNAAMIAGLAFHRRNIEGNDAFSIDVSPSLC
ncbi:MAG: tRNA (adenosine(37)-N6)-threonylcarbamoyltransferase complex transferase subunit TsaD [Kiritimatiellae bacterium]|nr:tRNA (adenosine(37)-N6)-threonylcarbamoyltransferase complex transferase subunit TsaD [Kiritimatiellia bacterium]